MFAVSPRQRWPTGYEDHFKSFDGKSRDSSSKAVADQAGTRINVHTGLSRAVSSLSYFVTRIADGRVGRGLHGPAPGVAIKLLTVFPTLAPFMSASKLSAYGRRAEFIDSHAMVRMSRS